MALESQNLERDDVSSSDEDEDLSTDKRVDTKLPSMRITKMKCVELKLNPDESDSDTGENAPTSGEEYIENLVESWRVKHEIKENNLDKNFRDTIHSLRGQFYVKIISRYRTVQSKISRVVTSFVAPEHSTDIFASKHLDFIIFLWREVIEESNPLLKSAEIFVLTSGWAFNLIHEDDCDDEFPKQIARRVLEFNLKTLSSKQLTGPQTSQALSYRENEGPHLSFWDYLGHITTIYSMPLRTNASLFRFPCFKKKHGRPGSVSVTVGENYLKINMMLSMKDIVETLWHFFCISKGKKTSTFPENEAETDDTNFDVLEHVTVVKGKKFVLTLDKMLCKNLQCFLDKAERVNMLLMHKNPEKWHMANEFSLQRKPDGSRKYKTIKVWYGSPPSIEEIFESTRLETQSTDIKTLFLQFHDNSADKQPKIRAPLLKLVEGHFKSKQGMPLFRYCGQWLQINNEYLTDLEKGFKEIMETNCLPSSILPLSWPYSGSDAPKDIKCKEKNALKRRSVPTTYKKFKKWYKKIFHEDSEISKNNGIPAQSVQFDEYKVGEKAEESEKSREAFLLFMRMHCHQAEKHYNEGYILYNHILVDESSGYLLGDRILMKGVELYDILYYTPEKTYLIHVKEGFGNTTRDACSQIRISADLVFRHIICNNNFDILNEFWKTVTNTGSEPGSYRSAVGDCYNKFGQEEFRNLFADREIIYVLAFRDNRKAQESYVSLVPYPEENLKSTFVDDFENVYNELLKCGFLYQQPGKVVITDKVIGTTLEAAERVIKLKTKARARKALEILKQSVSSHESFITKMEVVHLFSYFRQFRTPNRQLSFSLHSISKSLP